MKFHEAYGCSNVQSLLERHPYRLGEVPEGTKIRISEAHLSCLSRRDTYSLLTSHERSNYERSHSGLRYGPASRMLDAYIVHKDSVTLNALLGFQENVDGCFYPIYWHGGNNYLHGSKNYPFGWQVHYDRPCELWRTPLTVQEIEHACQPTECSVCHKLSPHAPPVPGGKYICRSCEVLITL
jgi:hypothetical protein